MHYPDKLKRKTAAPSAKAIGLILSLTVLSGCGEYGKPSIVAGVPVQVDYKKEQSDYDPSNPPLRAENYYFGLEQCPKDIELAKSGQPVEHPSFDPATHVHAADCFVREVQVPIGVYNQYVEGSTIILSGKVGQPVGRVG